LLLTRIKPAAEKYVQTINTQDLETGEVMIFDNNAYVAVKETETGLGAFELLVDPVSQIAYPEFGPNIMWNLKYSGTTHTTMMGSSGMMNGWNYQNQTSSDVTAEMTVTPYALEPNPGMIRLAEKHRRKTRLNIEFLDLPGERIPLEANSVDTVVSTFTLCTIPGIVEAIQGIARVLKPTGNLIFFELGLSPDPAVQPWQERLEPIHHWLFQGLYLTRDIPALLLQGGFQIEQIEKGYVAQVPKSLSYCWWGTATRAVAG
jgi:hypothetical protein